MTDPITITSHDIAPAAASTLGAPQQWMLNAFTGNPTGEAGPAVNEFTALNYSAVFKCVSLIAGKIAELPLKTYRRVGRGSEEATDRSEYRLLLREFNPNMSAMTARETMLGHLLTWGNAYCQIVWNKSGSTILQLHPQGPDITRPRRTPDGGVVYDIYRRGTGQVVQTLEADEIIHVPAMGFDGLVGYSPIAISKSTIRAGMSQDQQAERFVTRGNRSAGAVKFPPGKKFRDVQHGIQWRDEFRRVHNGGESDLGVIVLEDGADWVALGVDPKSAQLLDTRKYSTTEICGLYRVPPHLIGNIDSSTSWGTGIAEQTQGFVDYCLITWMRRIEAELCRKLCRDDPDVYYRHCVEEMLRGDIEKRTASLQIMHQRGIITDNEWRAVEHLNPVEGGDVRHYPLNESLIDEDGEVVDLAPPPPPTPPPVEEDDDEEGDKKGDVPAGGETDEPDDKAARMSHALRGVIVSATARCLRKEGAEAVKATSHPERFFRWVEEFYAKHATMVTESVGPAVEAWVIQFGGPSDYPARHVERSKRELIEAADGPREEFSARVGRLTERWSSERLAEVAAEFQTT